MKSTLKKLWTYRTKCDLPTRGFQDKIPQNTEVVCVDYAEDVDDRFGTHEGWVWLFHRPFTKDDTWVNESVLLNWQTELEEIESFENTLANQWNQRSMLDTGAIMEIVKPLTFMEGMVKAGQEIKVLHSRRESLKASHRVEVLEQDPSLTNIFEFYQYYFEAIDRDQYLKEVRCP